MAAALQVLGVERKGWLVGGQTALYSVIGVVMGDGPRTEGALEKESRVCLVRQEQMGGKGAGYLSCGPGLTPGS